MSQNNLIKIAAGAAYWLAAGSVSMAGSVFITEFCSDTGNNEKYEFVEFTNVGSTPVNMAGWSEDDSGATPNKAGHDLSAFGTLAPHESAIFTEASIAAFRAYWTLPATVKIIGGYTNDNLSVTSDAITLFDNNGSLVQRLDYSAANGGTADEVTRNAPPGALGLNNNSQWTNSFIGDNFSSYRAHALPGSSIIYGNPGYYPSPEPSTLVLAGTGVLGLLAARWRRRKANAAACRV